MSMCVSYLTNESGIKLIILNYISTSDTANNLSDFFINRVMIVHESSEECSNEEIGKLEPEDQNENDKYRRECAIL
jgi:hypothetical protein